MRTALFFLVCSIVCGTSLTQWSWAEDDTQCLREFKNSVTDPLNYLSSWTFAAQNTTQGYLCSFDGVQCWNGGESRVLSLNLQDAGLSGPFPLGLEACSSLTGLNLSGNSFSGPLPLDICKQMPFLSSLDLSSNQFEGSIPSGLGNCIYLHTLQLQSNHLSGHIPWELGLLPRLLALNLSSNVLSGRIPSSFFYKTIIPFDSSAFVNNPLLCGPPLSSNCTSHRNWIIWGSLVGALILILLLAGLAFLRRILLQSYTPLTRNGDTQSLPMFETHLKLTWEELQHATMAFSPACIIGKGGSSTVYKGRLLNGPMIAVKLLHNDELGFLHTPTQLFKTELAVLGKLRHRNLVRILGYFYNLERMAIVMDYMPAGSLDTLLRHERGTGNNTGFGWKERLGILMGIADGLAYLHHEYDGKVSVIHADLKPGNVLLDENMEAHIADFGIATFASAISTSNSKGLSKGQRLPVLPFAWSLGYTAPECVQQGVVSRKGDVFSFGITVLEVITGEPPSSNKLKEGESLVEWVSKALAPVEGMMEQVLAPILLRPDEIARWGRDISATLRMGCCCASPACASRPDMSTVVDFLHQLSGNMLEY